MTAISSPPSMQVFRTLGGAPNLSRVAGFYILYSIGFIWFPHLSALKTFKQCDQIWDLGVTQVSWPKKYQKINPSGPLRNWQQQGRPGRIFPDKSDGGYIPVADRGDRHRADPHGREHGVHVFGGFQNVEQGGEPKKRAPFLSWIENLQSLGESMVDQCRSIVSIDEIYQPANVSRWGCHLVCLSEIRACLTKNDPCPSMFMSSSHTVCCPTSGQALYLLGECHGADKIR